MLNRPNCGSEGVSRRRFLSNLSVATGTTLLGLQAAAPHGVLHGSGPASGEVKRVAVTIDDGPASGAGASLEAYLRISRGLRQAFTEEGVPGIVFVNESQLHVDGQRDARIRELERWLEDGLDIGNHTYSHKSLRDSEMEVFQDDVIKGEVVSRALLKKHGQQLRWFRYPYLHSESGERAAVVEAFLKQRGYRIAPVTVDYKDYSFTSQYSRYIRANESEQAEHFLQSVWRALDLAFDRAEKLSQEILGYQLPQVLLIHCNEMNSLTLREAFKRIRGRGYEFISLDEAMTDTAYQMSDLPPGAMGGWLMRGLSKLSQ